MGALRTLRKFMRRQISSDQERRTPQLELLEPRVLLSADLTTAALVQPLLVNLYPGLNDVSLRLGGPAGAEIVEVMNPEGVVQVQRPLDQVSEIIISGVPQIDDILRLDLDRPLPVPVAFDGGVGGGDTLRGSRSDNTWNVTGPDAGYVGAIHFADVENLVGGPDNEDMFVFEVPGSISGFVEGGVGGFDGLTLNGDVVIDVTYTSTGFGEGTVERGDDVIRYFGLEPLIDNLGGARTFNNATTGPDRIALRDVGAAADNRFIVDIDTAGQEDVTFANASGITSLTVNALAGNDVIVLDALDARFDGDLTIDAGLDDDDVTINVITGHGSYTIDGGGGTRDVLRYGSTSPITLSDTSLLGLRFPGTDVNVTQRPGVQGETAIAVDPTNPDHMIIGVNDLNSQNGLAGTIRDGDNVWVTVDGGKHWTREEIPTPPGVTPGRGDPTVVFDRSGRAIYAHLADADDLAAAVKPNQGDPWTAARILTLVSPGPDKELLAVGPRFGNLTQERIVVAYLDQTAGNRGIFVLASDDGGMTWNALGGTPATPTPVRVSTSGTAVSFACPAFGPNGEIYVVWLNQDTPGQSVVKFSASLNGGMNWEPERDIYRGNVNNAFDPKPGGGTGRYQIAAASDRGVNMSPSIQVDRSGGPHHGRIYVAFSDQKDQNSDPDTGTAAHDDLDIFVLASDDFTAGSTVPLADRGTNWNAHGGTGAMGSLRVSQEPGNASQFLPWLDVDQSNGNVAISWYDARNDTAGPPNVLNDQIEYFAAFSIDGGQTWSANTPVSDAISLGAQTGIGGVDFMEYSTLVFADGTMYMAWADRSNSTGDNPDFAGTNPSRLRDVYFDRASVQAAHLNGIERAVLRGPSINAAGFTGQVSSTTGVPDWTPQGPAPIHDGSPVGIPNNPVSGAIEAIAVDPRDLKSVYIATVGGGVWHNSDRTVLFLLNSFNLFDPADPVLAAQNQVVLDEVAAFLLQNPSLTHIKVNGYTDAVGTTGANDTLSLNRANAVVDYLVSKGVEEARLEVGFFGENDPIMPNDPTTEQQPLNRRVELIVNHWVPLTDQLPSTSLASIAISPVDADGDPVTAATPTNKLVIFAGTGSVSSSSDISGKPQRGIGLLRSRDGGANWQIVEPLKFKNSDIVDIVTSETGVVLVATDGVSTGGAGLFRGTVNGDVFANVATDGLLDPSDPNSVVFPSAAVSDLALDPNDPDRFYAAVPGEGVFVSTSGGQYWKLANNGLTGVADATRIELAISAKLDAGSSPVYAAIIREVTGDTLAVNVFAGVDLVEVAGTSLLQAGDEVRISGGGNPAGTEPETFTILSTKTVGSSLELKLSGDLKNDYTLTGSVKTVKRKHRLSGVFRSANDGASWASLPLPGTNETNGTTGFFGVHVEGNGESFFSIVADPFDVNRIYVGGDRQPGGGSGQPKFPNLIGARNFSGRLFVFDPDTNASAWVAITDNRTADPDGAGTLTGSAPHADSRAMAFQGIHLLEADDGGIYLLTKPGVVGTQAWSSFIADLAAIEFYDVAYDLVNDAIIGGAQDNGVDLQSATGAQVWNRIEGGDGSLVAADAVTGLAYSSQKLGDFTTVTVPFVNAVAATDKFFIAPAGTPLQKGDRVKIAGFTYTVTGTSATPAGDLKVDLNFTFGSVLPAGTPAHFRPSLFVNGVIVGGSPVTAAFVNPVALDDKSFIAPAGTRFQKDDVLTIDSLVYTVTATSPVGGNLKVDVDRGFPGVLPAGTVATLQRTLFDVDKTVQFTQPFVLNTITPGAILIGTNFVYESRDNGRTLTLRNGKLSNTTGTKFVPEGAADVGVVKALIYGGREPDGSGGFTDRDDVIYVGTNGKKADNAMTNTLWVRQAGGGVNGALSPLANYQNEGGAAVVDIAIDPSDWRKVYVLDENGDIWFSPNAGQTAVFPGEGGPNTAFWDQLSNIQLKTLPGADLLQQIAVERIGDTVVVLVSGEGGVFRKVGNGRWHEYGAGLPNSVATSLEQADSLLLAGTFGRGAWTVSTASGTLGTPAGLHLSGSGNDDVFYLERDAAQPWLLNVFTYLDGQPKPGTPLTSVPFASLEFITINGLGGNDRFIIDATNGAIAVPGDITIDGGLDSNTIQFLAGSATVFDITGVKFGPDPDSGSLLLSVVDPFRVSANQLVRWTHVVNPNVNNTVTVVQNVDTLRAGLGNLAAAFKDLMNDSLSGLKFAGLNLFSLGGALNGQIIEEPVEIDDPSDPTGESPALAGNVQLDNSTSWLLRLFEENGLKLSELTTSGAIADPGALRDKLVALFGAPNVSFNGGLTDEDGVAGNDLFYRVQVLDKHLTGIVDLDIDAEVDNLSGHVELTGLVQVDAEVDLDLSFGVGATGFFVKPNASVPEVSVNHLTVSGGVQGAGRFGFLGVDVAGGTLTLDPDVAITLKLSDPGMGPDADGIIRVSELSAEDAGTVVTGAVVPHAGGPDDVVFAGDFHVKAILPGFDVTLDLLTLNASLKWADATALGHVTIADNSGVSALLGFLNVTADDLVGQLTSLRDQVNALANAQGFVDLSLVQDVLDNALNLIEAFDDKVLDPLTSISGGTATLPTIQELAVRLADILGVDLSTLNLQYDNATQELTYHLRFTHDLGTFSDTLGFGFDFEPVGDFAVSTAADFNGAISVDVAFGADLGDLFGGASLADSFFVRDASVSANAAIDAQNINASARLGFLDVNIVGGRAYTFDPSADPSFDLSDLTQLAHPPAGVLAPLRLQVALQDPDGNTGDLDGARISLRELIDTVTSGDPLGLLGAPTVTGAAVAVLPLGVTSPLVIAASAATTIGVVVSDITDPASIDLLLPDSLDFEELLNFRNLGAADLLTLLAHLGTALQTLRSSLNVPDGIPFVSTALDKVVDLANLISDLTAGLRNPDGSPKFTTIQSLVDELVSLTPLDATQIDPQYDPLTNILSFRLMFDKSFNESVPLDFGTALGPLAVTGAADATLAANAAVDLRIGVDLSPLQTGDTLTKHLFIEDGGTATVDASITANDIDVAAALGILGLKVQNGSFNASVGTGITLKDPGTGPDADLRITFDELLNNISSVPVLDPLTATLAGNLPFAVTPLALSTQLGIDPMNPPAIAISLATPNDLSSIQFTPNAAFEAVLNGFADFGTEDIIAALQALVAFLKSSDIGAFNAEIPLLGRSVNDLLQVVDKLEGIVADLTAGVTGAALMPVRDNLAAAIGTLTALPDPPEVAPLTVVLEALNDAIVNGTPTNLPPTVISIISALMDAVDGLPGTIDKTALNGVREALESLVPSAQTVADKIADLLGLSAPSTLMLEFVDARPENPGIFERALVVRLHLEPDTAPITVPLNLSLEDFGPVRFDAGGVLEATLGGHVDLDFGFNFSTTTPFILDSSELAVTAQVDFPIFLNAGIGGITLELGRATDPGQITLKNAAQSGPAALTVEVTDTATPGDLGAYTFGDVLANLDPSIDGKLNATFPVYILGTDIGDLVVMLDLSDPLNPSITLPTDFLTHLLDADFDFQFLINGLDAFLTLLENTLTSNTLSKLPIIGGGLDEVGAFFGHLRTDFVVPLKAKFTEADPAMAVEQFILATLGPGGVLGATGILDPAFGGNPMVVDEDDVEVSIAASEVTFKLGLKVALDATADFDVGLDALVFDVQSQGQVQVALDFLADVGVGLNKQTGFFFLLNPDSSPEIEASFDASLAPGSTILAELFFLEVQATDSGGTGFNAAVEVNLDDPGMGTSADGRLSFSEIGMVPINPQMDAAATAQINLHLLAGTTTGSDLPQINADLVIAWDFLAGDDTAGQQPDVQLNNVELSLGSFFSRIAGPILDSVGIFLTPIRPVIDFLGSEVPVLSDLSEFLDLGPIFFYDLIPDASSRDSVKTVVRIVQAVDALASSISSLGGSTMISFGDFHFAGTAPAADLRHTFDFGNPGLYDPSSSSFLDEDFTDFNGVLDQIPGGAGKTQLQALAQTPSPSDGFGLGFPIFQSPGNLFKLLFGQTVNLVVWDIPPLSAEFPISIPLFDFLGVVSIEVFGSIFAKADLAVGLDTRGLGSGLSFFDGFFIADKAVDSSFNPTGDDIPELTVGFEVGVEAAAGVPIIGSASVQGGIHGEVTANANDPNHDGKIYFDELRATAAGGLSCLFDLGGVLEAFLRVRVKALCAPWPLDDECVFDDTYNITPPVELFNFDSFTCTPLPPPELAHVSDGTDGFEAGTLVLHMGPYAGLRQPGASTDVDESFTLQQTGANQVKVTAFEQTQTYDGVLRIHGDGGLGTDAILLCSCVNLEATLSGGPGDDRIQGGSGPDVIRGDSGAVSGDAGNDDLSGASGNDTIYGDGGDDAISGGDDADELHGGDGADTVRGGKGNDIIFGDGNDDRLLGEEDADELHGGAGDDDLRGGPGADSLFGEEDADALFGQEDDDLLVGGPANDNLIGGHGSDNLIGGTMTTGTDSDGNDVLIGDFVLGDPSLGQGSADTLIGDNGIIGSVTLGGGAGNDILIGGDGGDFLYGQAGNDMLAGDNATFNPITSAVELSSSGTPGDDYLEGNAGNDTIYGGGGDDLVLGGSSLPAGSDGADSILGNEGDDVLLGDNGTISPTGHVITNAAGGAGSDTISGGPGADVLFGGGLGDRLFGDDAMDDGDDVVVGDEGSSHPGGMILAAHSVSGGSDIIVGRAGRDILLGGDDGDTIGGDAGDDILVGDNGQVILSGGVVTRIETTEPEFGGNDAMTGGSGKDLLIGGDGADGISAGDDDDWAVGDNARFDFEPISGDEGPTQLAQVQTTSVDLGDDDTIDGGAGNDILVGGAEDDTIVGKTGIDVLLGDQAIIGLNAAKIASVEDPGTIGDDILTGDEDPDLIIGGLGNDAISGSGAEDVLIGDTAHVLYDANGVTSIQVDTTSGTGGGVDTMYGGPADDVLIGGANADNLDGGMQDDLIFGDNVLLVRNVGSGDAIDPRFRGLTDTTIYGPDGAAQVASEFGPAIQPVPGGRPAWADWTITVDQTAIPAQFGDDYIAGGGGNDEIFGQLGDDTIQGDGSIDLTVDAGRTGGSLTVNASDEASTDGDDYIEGNAGSDVIFGNLGQDDIVGGSSNLFSLTTTALQPDGTDIIFGGAGTDIARHDPGDTSASGHARDADVILADNGDLFRLVGTDGANSGNYLTFTYDNYGPAKIIPRVYVLLDYLPGGATSDIGGNDLVLGESGDDVIHGQKGNDVLYGDGQDDDIYGGTGLDRLFGGTGEDGIVGDDGKIYTSRNGLTETLYGLTTPNAETQISLPGPFTGAWIFISGRLNKAAELEAYTVGGDDIIYGGLGDDFLHAGAGDDGVSGAEAVAAFYSDAAAIVSGNFLGYDPVTRKLAAYDANNPFAKIAGFFLNFDATDAAGQKINDGKDRLFGDLGNDWLVGGTENDRMFGGMGDDVHNLDDNQDTPNNNEQPDAVAYADRDFAYGGGGLDVLIANTGGDRMFDFTGEFNSFLVPFTHFGHPTINRSPSPHVDNFLRGLARESGNDFSLPEPAFHLDGELGLTSQEDSEWGDQHGGPRDPQPGHTHAKRDTQGGPEDDRNTALPLAAPAGAPVPSGGAVANSADVTVNNVTVSQDPSNLAQMALFVGGGSANDVIEIRRGTSDAFITVTVNGVSQQFARGTGTAAINRVIAYGNGGNDTITIFDDLNATIAAALYGGDGNDTLKGGKGANFLDGGDGNDTLSGNSGNDIVVGSLGTDTVHGDQGYDVVIGGTWSQSTDLDAVNAVMAAWNTSASLDQRRTLLKAGVGTDAIYKLNFSTVFDDAIVDLVFGDQQKDWLWIFGADQNDKGGSDLAN